MNQKEISELKRRFKLGKNAISHICGCYVNSKKEIVSYLNEPLDRMPEEEAEKYLALLKKVLSALWAGTSSTSCFPPSRWRTSWPCGTPS